MTLAPARLAVPGWPLAVVFLGLPLWWVVGVWQLMFLAMAVPMAFYLLRERTIRTPRGFWVWLLWMGWVLTGLLVLQIDAPGAVPGNSFGRYLTFGFRFSWYVAATIVALYILNTRRELSTERVSRLVAWFFVMLIGGGLLGSLVPTLSFPSLLQLALPGALAQQQFVHDLIHVQVAQVQTFLGEPQARPSAPFPYTNDWGLATAAALPFFAVAWWRRGPGWRVALVSVSVVATYVIVSSVNRGMWVAILTMALFVIARSVVLGRIRMMLLALVMILAAAIIFLYTPLGDLVQARLDNPHSDQGRANLGLRAVQSTATGSPILGFGTTRDVAGNFTSIAGGASAACPRCEPPPLGTHGQLWLTIFGAGFVGAALFLTFLISQLLRNLAVRSPYGVAALCTLITLAVTLPIYSSVGVALYLGFIAIGLLARESQADLPSLQSTVRPVLTHPLVLTLAAAIGGLTGLATHAALGAPVQAHQSVLVPAADLVPVPGTRPFTLDGEALVATSDPVIRTVSTTLGMDPRETREAIRIGAHPNTRVLVINFTAQDADLARRGVELVTQTYLEERYDLRSLANDAVSDRYQTHLGNLDDIFRETVALAPSAPDAIIAPVIADLRDESRRAADVLLNVGDAGAGRPINAPAVDRSSDVATTRIASGLALGLLFGVPTAHMLNQRRLQLGVRPGMRLGRELPVLIRVREQDIGQATRVVDTVLPLAGITADPDSSRSLRMAGLLAHDLGPQHCGGRRSLIVVEPQTRVSTIRHLYDEQVTVGLEPVGLIVCLSNRRRE